MKQSFNKGNMDDLIKDKLGGHEEKPSELLWYGIDAELDQIPFSKPISKFRLFFRVLMLLIVFAGGASFYFLWNGPENTLVLQSPFTLTDKISPDAFAEINISESKEPVNSKMNDLSSALNKYKSLSEKLNLAALTFHKATAAELFQHDEKGTSSTTQRNPSLEISALKTIYMKRLLTVNAPSLSGFRNPAEVNYELDEQDISGFHIGPTISYSHTWNVQDKFQENLTRRSLSSAFNGGVAFGISAGYVFNGRFGVQVDWLVSSNEGHGLKIPNEMAEEREDITLNYMRVPVLFKYRMSRLSSIKSSPMVINYIAGVEFGRLNWISIDEPVEFMKPDDFNKHEWGIILGLEYDLHFSENYFLTLGARGRVATDMNEFPSMLHNDLEKMHNFSLGLTARLNYLIH